MHLVLCPSSRYRVHHKTRNKLHTKIELTMRSVSDSPIWRHDIYTLPCIKQVTNENLLCSIGDPTQCSAETKMGRKSQNEGICVYRGLPRWLGGKESAGDMGLIPGLGRSPGERNSNPLQYPCLGNPSDRGAWWATVHGVAKEVRCNLGPKEQQP